MRYTPRVEWGGPATAPGHVTSGSKMLIVLHHTHSPHRECGATRTVEKQDMLGMHRYHVSKDWGGFSYNWAIFQSGNIYEGRGWGRTGAHTIGRNSSSVGIVLVIDGEHNEPTPAAIESFREVQEEGVNLGFIANRHEVAPHDRFQQKICPGKLVKSSGLIGGSVSKDPGTILKSMPSLRKGSGGQHAPSDIQFAVRELQRRLGLETKYQTGFFGDITLAAVLKFQRTNGLKDDGIVGPKTWSKLLT